MAFRQGSTTEPAGDGEGKPEGGGYDSEHEGDDDPYFGTLRGAAGTVEVALKEFRTYLS